MCVYYNIYIYICMNQKAREPSEDPVGCLIQGAATEQQNAGF